MVGKSRERQAGLVVVPLLGELAAADLIALALSALWLLGAGLFWLFAPEAEEVAPGGSGSSLMTLLAIVLPVALIWVGAMAARIGRELRAENERLRAAIAAMREGQADPAFDGASGARQAFEEKLDEIARVQKKTEAALAHLTSVQSRAAAQANQRAERAALPTPKATEARDDRAQASLALGTPAEMLTEPISAEDFIRALDFPADEHDKPGFRALRRALRDRAASGLVRSAQDILTLLAEDGIYMDDLAPDPVEPDVWRRFARGERGEAIGALGAIRDRSSLALTAGRMRQDPVFRDCAHHFLRKFDTALSAFETAASDLEIEAFADTRSARAFMLVGRVSGTFD